jgi:CHRD domain-containing protein
VHTLATRIPRTPLVLVLVAAITVGAAPVARASILNYIAFLNGANESPPVVSAGVGSAEVTIDDVAHTMRVQASFTGLNGNTTACHIHAPTVVAGTGTAGVATTTPYFAGFPIGVKSGVYDNTLDLTLATSYNPSYITANGGTTASAEVALLAAIAAGKAYFNIHSTTSGGGEIRGFLELFFPTATAPSSWGRIKSLYR